MASCRFCDSPLKHTFVDLGMSPLANEFLGSDKLTEMEPFYPLRAYVCDRCLLVQLPKIVSPEAIFSDYPYFSSYAETWLEHARAYANKVTNRFSLTKRSRIVEVASNDGYLLQYFLAKGMRVLGIEPAANVAAAAIKKGIPTLVLFFGKEAARQLVAEDTRADLLIGNNVLAHVPELNDFVEGLKILIEPRGVITLEFPHVMRLMEGNQFDTIYHEHVSYFSFNTVEKIFRAHDLTIFDVEELPTHGGSLRIYARRRGQPDEPIEPRVAELREREIEAGLGRLETYLSFGEKVNETKRNLLEFLIEAKREKKTIVAYGAAAKGTTLLNYCGLRSDFIDYTVDRSPHKQGKFVPGTGIPIYDPEKVKETKPDYLLILPWNLKEEIMRQMAYVRKWGGKFVIPIPKVEVL